MVEQIHQQAEEKMKKAVENTRQELVRIRTGRANPVLLDGIRVDYYGTKVPLKQVATVSVPETRLITVHPWEKQMLDPIEKAILASDLGLTPTNDGRLIRLPIPQLTEERRKELVKVVRGFAEEGKIAVRNIRREANDRLKKTEKGGEISEDQSHRGQDKIQELTDRHVHQIDELLVLKEQEIMEV